jgi:hypothetical protein
MQINRFLIAAMSILAGPLMAQEPGAFRWVMSVSAGPGFGGPGGQLQDRLVQEQWTDRFCDFQQTNCRTGPSSERVFIQVAAALGRRLSDKLELKAVFEFGDLGEVTGAKGQYELKATWKTTTLGTAIILHPVPRVRIGGGPLIGMLSRRTLPTENPNPLRAGFFLEGGIRSSERSTTFLELVISYRMLPRLPEGPWPGTGNSSQVFVGPARIDADFSHFTVGLGAGIRF